MSSEGPDATLPVPPSEDELIELEVLEPDGTRSRIICAAIEGATVE